MKKQKIKPRVPVAKPQIRHKSDKDYNRKKLKEKDKKNVS